MTKTERKRVIEINGKMILNEAELSRISGGNLTNANPCDCTTINVKNYYLNWLPCVDRKHIKVTASSAGWNDVPGKPNTKESNVRYEAVCSDMKWKNLSGKEKFVAAVPVAGLAFVAAGVLVPAALRYVKKRLGV